jgi:hypothetical protein
MSKYMDNQPLFLEPTVNQYGSHMVMTNVQKASKKKYMTIDTRFRDNYEATYQTANYMITLPERINEVKTIKATSVEIPVSFNNISANLGNNQCTITNMSTHQVYTITIPDGQYDASALKQAFTTQLNTAGLTNRVQYVYIQTSTANPSPTYSVFNNIDPSNSAYLFDFSSPSTDHRFTLGWLLGFRPIKESTATPPYQQSKFQYTVPQTTAFWSTAFLDTNGPRYLYLIIDEFTSGNQNSFHSLLQNSAINKNILARITLTNKDFPFGTILPANNLNGLLQTDTRSYNGKVDLQRMNIQLVNEEGIPMNLNGLDFTFCLEMEYE